MKAFRIHEHGDADCLKLDEIDVPELKADEALVKVKAGSLNHLDLWVRGGLPGMKFPLPMILGSDVVGVVEETGELVDSVRKGDEVIVNPGTSCGTCIHCLTGNDSFCRRYSILGESCDGGNAEYIAVRKDNLFAKPGFLSFEEASAIPLVFITAWNMLINKCDLNANSKVLVLGGNSGVGSSAIQIAKALGCYVIATAGSDEKMEKALELGADHVINHYEDDFPKVVKKLTDKSGVDIVFEHVGKATFLKSLSTLSKGGKLVTCGATTGYDVEIDLRFIFFKQLQILGSTMGSRSDLVKVLDLITRKKLKPLVDKVFPFSELPEAHKHLEKGNHFGKVVLKM